MKKTVLLYGELGKKFGKTHKLNIQTPLEAIRALAATIPGFREYMYNNRTYAMFLNYEDQVLSNWNMPFSSKEILRIVPIVSGSGAFARIIIGAALIFAAGPLGGFVSGLGIGQAGPLTAAGMLVTKAATTIGWSLVFGGVAEVLFGTPKLNDSSYETTKNTPSYTFGGAVNTTRQGNPVAIGYGKLRVGSQVISAGLEAQAL